MTSHELLDSLARPELPSLSIVSLNKWKLVANFLRLNDAQLNASLAKQKCSYASCALIPPQTKSSMLGSVHVSLDNSH